MPGFRLIFVLAVSTLAACGPERPPWADGRKITTVELPNAVPQSLANFGERLLALHNRERREAGAAAMTWDPALAAAAAAYARTLAGQGRLVHSAPEARAGQGENLWMGTAGRFQLDEMVGHWAAEKSLFRPGAFPDVSASRHWSDVAHYTQMIWPGTNRLGCALQRNRRDDFLVCRYAPVGNVIGQRVP